MFHNHHVLFLRYQHMFTFRYVCIICFQNSVKLEELLIRNTNLETFRSVLGRSSKYKLDTPIE